MRFKKDFAPSLVGSLIVAHPGMLNAKYKRAVVLLSSDSPETGTLGIIVNAPLNKTLGEFDALFEGSALAKVPLFYGGPVDKHLIILTAWQWMEQKSIFKLDFGITEQTAVKLLKTNPHIEIRAFLGYSSWTHEQILKELKQRKFLLSSVKHLSRNMGSFELWKSIIKKISPELFFLAQSPEDPAEN